MHYTSHYATRMNKSCCFVMQYNTEVLVLYWYVSRKSGNVSGKLGKDPGELGKVSEKSGKLSGRTGKVSQKTWKFWHLNVYYQQQFTYSVERADFRDLHETMHWTRHLFRCLLCNLRDRADYRGYVRYNAIAMDYTWILLLLADSITKPFESAVSSVI